MAYTQTKKTTELEKRLNKLKVQLYGKEVEVTGSGTSQIAGRANTNLPLSETSYLKKDLIKIFLVSSFLIGIQISFFLALRNNLLKLPF